MPPRKRTAKRRAKPKRSTYSKKNYISPAPFPKQKWLRMRYHTTTQLTCTSGIPSAHNYSCNSLYDPDFTGAGHQPMGYDQMALLYNHYLVAGAKITVKCIPTVPSATGNPIFWGIRVAPTSTFGLTFDSIVENKMGRYKLLSNSQSVNSYQVQSKGFSCKKFFNITDIKDNSTMLGANFSNTGGPSEQAFFQVFMGSVDAVSSTNTYLFDITIDYIMTCNEPKTLAQS